MSELPGESSEYFKKKLKRREFLRLGGLVSILAVAGSGELEKSAIGWFFEIFADPKRSETVLNTAATTLRRGKENPDYKPIEDIVGDGVKQYEGLSSGQNAYFKKSDDYHDFEFYQAKIDEIKASIGILPRDPAELELPFIRSLPESAKTAVNAADSNFGDYLNVMSSTSGMYHRFEEKYPQFRGKQFLDASDTVIRIPGIFGITPVNQAEIPKALSIIDTAKAAAKEYILAAKNYVENEVAKNEGKPISASKLLAYFLEKNQGNISESLDDTYIFLKFAARNRFEDGDFTAKSEIEMHHNIAWMQGHISDEYGSSSYMSSEDPNDLINLVGKPYHSWSLVSLLSYLPSEIVEIAGLYRQLRHITEQGADKMEADLVTMASLKKVEGELGNWRDRRDSNPRPLP